ncbi:CU044_5270 family protein [Salinispora mooreana]|uniref:CU044_5270 family protein n=1 Tax=Salinispora mooreana TaxID=999545 RepID=UPI0003732EC7|nr:CU044_5270 family protein [Salinispora mooreana]
MKDLDLIKQLGEDLAPTRDEQPTPIGPAFRDSPRRRSPQVWQLGLAMLALVGAAAIVTGAWHSPSSPPIQAATPQAAAVLTNAALVAQQSTTAALQDDGYVFTETVSSYPAQVEQPDGSFKVVREAPVVTQVWLPLNPNQGGKQRQRSQKGNADWEPWAVIDPCPQKQDRVQSNNSFSSCRSGVLSADFPTDSAAVLAWLRGDGSTDEPNPQPSSSGPISSSDFLALEKARELLLAGTYLSPQQRSLIYKALAQIPGIVAIADVQDGAGRPGIGISAGGSEALVFDPTTYTFLGTTSSAVMRQDATTRRAEVPS